MSEKIKTGAELLRHCLDTDKALPENSKERVELVTHVSRRWNEEALKGAKTWYEQGMLLHVLFIAFAHCWADVLKKASEMKLSLYGRKASRNTLRARWLRYRVIAPIKDKAQHEAALMMPESILNGFAGVLDGKAFQESEYTFDEVLPMLTKAVSELPANATEEDQRACIKGVLDTLNIKAPGTGKKDKGTGKKDKGTDSVNLEVLFVKSPFEGITDLEKKSEAYHAGLNAMLRFLVAFQETIVPGKPMFSTDYMERINITTGLIETAFESIDNEIETRKETESFKKAVNE